MSKSDMCRTRFHRSARYISLFLALLLQPGHSPAANNDFDLVGPRIEMKVTRKGKPLPISDVANLQPGDRIWIHPDFPPDQSARYLMIVAFLRGPTNPPPESWFIKAETWTKEVREEGIVVTVPEGASQALLFLAPQTGGDFATLRAAVRGRPGVFVRASQDLNRASLDRTRLEKYLTDIKTISDADPKALQQHSVLMARTLGIRLDLQCFDKQVDEQASCLTRNTDNLVLDDGQSQSMVQTLASGPNTDLIGAVSATPMAGGGFYSAYVGAVVDLARVLGNMHTASFVYIPALALPKQDQMNLRLNNPPSFRKPKSVIVVGLPAIESAQLPPLRAVNPDQVYCLQKSALVLPVEGAPLVFSSDIAHDFSLHVQSSNGAVLDLPARAVPSSGGFRVDAHAIDAAKMDPEVIGTLRGFWGFEPYEGPNFRIRIARTGQWKIPPAEQTALIVGREDTFHVQSSGAACVEEVKIQDQQGREVQTTWRRTRSDELEVKVALKDQLAGPMTMKVRQYGLHEPEDVHLRAYAELAYLESFAIHAGDENGVLKGTRLDEVERFELNGVHFTLEKLTRANTKDELQLSAAHMEHSVLASGQRLVAHVALKDGRVLDLPTIIDAPRPKMALIAKNIEAGPTPSGITLGSLDELPLDGQISFLLKTEIPEKLSRDERVEVSTVDSAFSIVLSIADGSLVARDSQIVSATLDPERAFGPSAFGPLRFRPVEPDGTKGDWQPLATLVRVPQITDIHCPRGQDQQCRLSGTNLFLIDSVASDAQFTHTAPVPTSFIESTLNVPRPTEAVLYVRLRDDPATINTVAFPLSPVTKSEK